jgi:CubicO group peptidase (beta-lactamase class C family)
MKYFSILIAILLATINLSGQTNDLPIRNDFFYSIHKANIGKIAFMGTAIPIEKFNQSDFLSTFELKNKTDLNIRVFLGNTLTEYLRVLAPALTNEELKENGNYQFTFYIDNQLIYVENLNTKAGSSESKEQRTVFRVPLISSSNEDSWGRFLWNRFIADGGQEAFTNGEHTLKIEIRPYLKLSEVLTGNIIAEGQLKIIVPDIKIDENLIQIQNIKSTKDWIISKGKVDTSRIEELNRKIANQTFIDITSIVVIKDGQLLIEEYFNGATRKSLHDTRSVGKSFTSALLGIAIKDGFIKSENQTLNEFYNLKSFQNYSSTKDNITLKSLLTMSSPINGSDIDSESIGNEENMYPTNNWVEFALNLPIDTTKISDRQWDYFTAGVVVLGDIIHKSIPNGLEKYANKNLFSPLNIKKYKWQFTPQKVVNTAGSLQMRSLDYAKFGQLYRNKGNWNGKQILSKDWVDKSLSHQMVISEDEYYGYLFWNKFFKINGAEKEAYYASGNGGNRIIIFKDQPIVIVITSTAFNSAYGHKQAERIVQDYLIPAITK